MPAVTARLRVLGETVTATASFTLGAPPLLGMTAQPGDTALTFSTFADIAYFRDFGKDTADPDSLTELTPHGTGKLAQAPAACVAHVSWKDDVEALGPWLSAAPGDRSYYVTWHHEPMGDMTPAAYRSSAGKIPQILAGHPKAHLVLGHGPVVTRYWLEQPGNSAADWAYPGMTFFGGDCYNGSTSFYRTPAQMFGSTATAARSFGVPWLVPEYGIERITTDGSGAGRAQTMRDHIAWARTQPDCLAIGWWNIGGDRITGLEPEQTAWRELLAG